MKNRKKAFSLVEVTISIVLLALLVAIASSILGITVYSSLTVSNNREIVNGYDVFLNDFVYFVKHASTVTTEGTPVTRIIIVTHDGESREFEFENNRLRIDDYTVMKAKQGYFQYDGRSVMVSMKPDNIGASGSPVTLRVNIDCTYY